MENLFIAATPTSPEVDFCFDRHQLSLRGESYPENAAAFYGPIMSALQAYLALPGNAPITVSVALVYFNSSSTKMLFGLFNALDEAARAGRHVALDWYHDEDDDTIFEFGQELHDDFDAIAFHDHPVA